MEGKGANLNIFPLPLLPIEVFSDITDLLGSFDIGRLWFGGNKALNRALKLGIRQFEHFASKRSSWPSLILEFTSLRRFSIICDKKIPRFIETTEDMRIPTSVTELRVNEYFLAKILHSNPEILTRLTTFDLTAINGDLQLFSDQLNAVNFPVFKLEAPLVCRPEVLTTVTQLTVQNTQRARRTFQLDKMPKLTSATSIGVNFKKLPLHLTRVHVLHPMNAKQLQELPSTVTDLLYRPTTPTMEGFVKILNLPLISLVLDINRSQIGVPGTDVIDKDMAQRLPDTLESISVNQLNLCIGSFPFLPSRLRRISLGRSGKVVFPSGTEPNANFEATGLPKTLESFQSNFLLPCRVAWPENMREIGVQLDSASYIPKETESGPNSKKTLSYALPPGLDTLHTISWKDLGETKRPLQLPSRLRSLGVSFLYSPHFEVGAWLPSSVEVLMLIASTLGDPDAAIPASMLKLPPTLVSLTLIGSALIGDDSIFKEVSFPSLVKLEVNPPLKCAKVIMELKAPQLEFLKFQVSSTIVWQDMSFTHFKKLRTLFISPYEKCGADEDWPTDWIQRFPPRLIEFNFPAHESPNSRDMRSQFKNAGIRCHMISPRYE